MSEHKTDRLDAFCVGMMSGVIIMSTCGFFLLRSQREESIKEERQNAVKAGVARYVPDEKGDPKFEYIEPQSPNPLTVKTLRQ